MSGEGLRRPGDVAAGVVALRRGAKKVKVLLVHRPKYDDWVLPKGHVEPGELIPEAACREFLEETGYQARLVAPICHMDYPVDKARSGVTMKRVHWFLGEHLPIPAVGVADPAEIDAVAWKRLDVAINMLSYDDERDVLAQSARVGLTKQLLIVRHAKARDRQTWKKEDWRRPLAARGRRQAQRLTGLLAAYGVADLASSPSTRCLETLQPYAGLTKLPIELLDGLSEETASRNPVGVGQAMDALRGQLMASDRPLAVCGHRPVLPAMAAQLGIADGDDLKPGEVLVVHLDAYTGEVVATGRYPSPQ